MSSKIVGAVRKLLTDAPRWHGGQLLIANVLILAVGLGVGYLAIVMGLKISDVATGRHFSSCFERARSRGDRWINPYGVYPGAPDSAKLVKSSVDGEEAYLYFTPESSGVRQRRLDTARVRGVRRFEAAPDSFAPTRWELDCREANPWQPHGGLTGLLFDALAGVLVFFSFKLVITLTWHWLGARSPQNPNGD